MMRRLFAALLAALTVVVLTGAVPASAAAADYTGIIKLSNCSGSLVRLPASLDTDPALALTNGHCDENGTPGPGEVIVDRPSDRTMTLLGPDGRALGELRATKLAYGTMTDTDIALYQLDSSYQAIASRLGGQALALSDSHPAAGTSISVISGYFKRTWTCDIDKFVHRLREAGWTWRDSIRYTPACDTIHGTSGSPIVDNVTHRIIGVNNTGNDDGESCTLNNPCEVEENGQVSFQQGRTYGQQTYLIAGCIDTGNRIDLGKPGCALPKPAILGLPATIPA